MVKFEGENTVRRVCFTRSVINRDGKALAGHTRTKDERASRGPVIRSRHGRHSRRGNVGAVQGRVLDDFGSGRPSEVSLGRHFYW